jgi:hypothetical protein
MKDKTITIDDLARMINAGFNNVTNDIGEVKQDMTGICRKFAFLGVLVSVRVALH